MGCVDVELARYGAQLYGVLEAERHILFGEWCTLVHSLEYTSLPGYFIAFDLYDRETNTFASREELHTKLRPTGIPVVPIIAKGVFNDRADLLKLLDTPSKFRVGDAAFVEGVYLKCEEGGGVVRRCKLVRPDFVQGITTHWMTHIPVKQGINRDMGYDGYTEARADQAADQAADQGADVPTADCLTPLDPRARHMVALDGGGADVKLPRNFSFVVAPEWAVSSTPKNREQVRAFRQLGIRLVVTLTEETPLDPAWFEGTGVANSFYPVPNYHPPTTQQMDDIVDEVAAALAAGGKVMEHCGGGKGRAGTVAACLLLRFGVGGMRKAGEGGEAGGGAVMCHMSSAEAIAYLRHIRPGSLETKHQEDFVRDYANHLWSKAAAADDMASGTHAADAAAGTATPAAPAGAKEAQNQKAPAPARAKARAKARARAPAAEAPADAGCVVGDGDAAATVAYAVGEDVRDELEALGAIFGSAEEGQYALVSASPPTCDIRVQAGGVAHAATARFTLGPLYPRTRCAITLHRPVGMTTTQLHALHAKLVQEADANTGEPMVYTLTDAAREWMEQQFPAPKPTPPPAARTANPRSAGSKRRNKSKKASDPSKPFGYVAGAEAASLAGCTQPELIRRFRKSRRDDVDIVAHNAGGTSDYSFSSAFLKSQFPRIDWWSVPTFQAGTAGGGGGGGGGDAEAPPKRKPAPKEPAPTPARPPPTAAAKLSPVALAFNPAAPAFVPSFAAPAFTPAVARAQPVASAKAPAKNAKKEKKEAAAAAALQKGNMKRAPDVIMLVGMPGSGKSTFGQVLGQCGWQRVSQDDQGKKLAQDLAGRHSKVGQRCVLDRCNVEVEERKTWLGLMHDPLPKRTACIFFDVSADECVRRVFKREGHPTIKAGTPGSERIVRGFAKRLVPPTKAEGFGHVHTIRTFQQANDLLVKFGVPGDLIAAAMGGAGAGGKGQAPAPRRGKGLPSSSASGRGGAGDVCVEKIEDSGKVWYVDGEQYTDPVAAAAAVLEGCPFASEAHRAEFDLVTGPEATGGRALGKKRDKPGKESSTTFNSSKELRVRREKLLRDVSPVVRAALKQVMKLRGVAQWNEG